MTTKTKRTEYETYLDMISDYISEPNTINKEWVDLLIEMQGLIREKLSNNE